MLALSAKLMENFALNGWLRAPLTRAGVLVTPAADLQLRAFHAVCTHRDSALFDLSAPEEGGRLRRADRVASVRRRLVREPNRLSRAS